jgi:hypothetical protein
MQDFLKTIAPWLGAAATGGIPALAGMAVSKIAEVMGLDGSPTAESVMNALKGATPEQMLMLKKADQDFEAKMKELGFKHIETLAKIDADDRNSARQREMTVRDGMPAILGLLITFGFFGILAWMLAYGIPPNGGEALLIMLGSLGTAWISVVAYYFGSSSSSQKKTDLLAKAQPVA